MKAASEKPRWKRYAITVGIGLVGFLLMMFAKDGFRQTEPAAIWSCVMDAFFVPGILILSVGLLVWVSDGGVFDMIRFGLMKVFSVMFTRKIKDDQPKTFYDYRVMRQAKEPADIKFLLLVGAIFVALAGLSLLVTLQYDPALLD